MRIARALKNITETVIVPEGSFERYVPSLSPECIALQRVSMGLSGLTDAAEGYFVERNGHFVHELLFCLAGEGSAKSKGNVTSPLYPGDMLIAPCDTYYSYRCEKAPWRFMWFQLQDKGIWHNLRSLPVHVRKSGYIDNIESAMVRLLSESTGQDLHWARITTLQAELVVLNLERELALSDSPHERKVRQRLEELWGMVTGRLDMDWTISDLAARANMSTSSFFRACERHMGLNPKQVLLRLRMQRAEELLLYHDYPLKTIAEMVGYGSPFSFSNAFKRYKKVSPKTYRTQVAVERGG